MYSSQFIAELEATVEKSYPRLILLGRVVCQGWPPGTCPIPVMKELKRKRRLYLTVIYLCQILRLVTGLPGGKKLASKPKI